MKQNTWSCSFKRYLWQRDKTRLKYIHWKSLWTKPKRWLIPSNFRTGSFCNIRAQVVATKSLFFRSTSCWKVRYSRKNKFQVICYRKVIWLVNIFMWTFPEVFLNIVSKNLWPIISRHQQPRGPPLKDNRWVKFFLFQMISCQGLFHLIKILHLNREFGPLPILVAPRGKSKTKKKHTLLFVVIFACENDIIWGWSVSNRVEIWLFSSTTTLCFVSWLHTSRIFYYLLLNCSYLSLIGILNPLNASRSQKNSEPWLGLRHFM